MYGGINALVQDPDILVSNPCEKGRLRTVRGIVAADKLAVGSQSVWLLLRDYLACRPQYRRIWYSINVGIGIYLPIAISIAHDEGAVY